MHMRYIDGSNYERYAGTVYSCTVPETMEKKTIITSFFTPGYINKYCYAEYPDNTKINS